MSFREYFKLIDPVKMDFELMKPKEEMQSQSTSKRKQCMICHSGIGKMLECAMEDCDKQAHPYCIMNYLKDYYYDTAFREDVDSEKKYLSRWMYQLFYDAK